MTDELFTTFEGFTCLLYGNRKVLDIDSLREKELMKTCDNEVNRSRNVDIGSLPPCKK